MSRNSKISLRELQLQRQPLTTVAEVQTPNSSTGPNNKNQSVLKATPIVHASTPTNKQYEKINEDYDDDDDVRSGVNQPIRPKTSGATPSIAPSSPLNNPGKELTPKERMMLNKLKKADEQAVKVGYITCA